MKDEWLPQTSMDFPIWQQFCMDFKGKIGKAAIPVLGEVIWKGVTLSNLEL